MAQIECKSCNKFNSFRIVKIKKKFGEGCMNLSIFSLKNEVLLQFLRLGSKLFHSVIRDRKKEFLKKLCFVLIKGILPRVLVTSGVLLTGMRLKRYFVCLFSKTL